MSGWNREPVKPYLHGITERPQPSHRLVGQDTLTASSRSRPATRTIARKIAVTEIQHSISEYREITKEIV